MNVRRFDPHESNTSEEGVTLIYSDVARPDTGMDDSVQEYVLVMGDSVRECATSTWP